MSTVSSLKIASFPSYHNSQVCLSSLHDLDAETNEVSQGILSLLQGGGGLCSPSDLVEVLFTEEAIRFRSRLEICNQLINAGIQQVSEVEKLERKLKRLQEELALVEEEKQQQLLVPPQTSYEDYDLIVEIPTISQLMKQGWPVYTPVSKGLKCDMNSLNMNIDTAIVAVVGRYHSGKTLLLKKLSGSPLPCNSLSPTKGLSFKQACIDTDTALTLLDTAGSCRPVKVQSELSIAEQEVTEMFLQDVALDLSDYFLFVVNDWTTTDQRDLHRIETHLANSPHRVFPEIIVIHNMKDIRTEEELRFVWTREIVETLGLAQQTEVTAVHPSTGQITTKSVAWVKTSGRRHICLVNDYCVLGQKINPWTLGLLKCWLKGIVVPVTQPQPLLTQVMSLMDQKLSVYYRKRVHLEIRKEGNGQAAVVAQIGNHSPSSDYLSSSSPNINPDTFLPTMDILKSTTTFTVFLDLPGFSPSDISLSRQSTATIVQGRQPRPTQKGKCLRHERKTGEFVVSIVVPQEYEKRWSSAEMCNGVLTIVYKWDAK